MTFKSLVKPCLVKYFQVVAKSPKGWKPDHKEIKPQRAQSTGNTGLARTLGMVQESVTVTAHSHDGSTTTVPAV